MDERGPLVPYEVIWRHGHIETIQAHQVIWPSVLGMFETAEKNPRVFIHGEIDGHWRLLLAADADDILSIRALSNSEHEAQR